jgi:glycosyltransferase involved in cell wall biosynthesis
VSAFESSETDRARRVAVYRSPVLPLSETFIRDQVSALTRWRATLVGEMLMADRPSLDGVALRALPDTALGRFARRADRAAELLLGHSPRKRFVVRSLQPTLVHVHFATEAVNLWPTIARLGLPMIVTLHGYDINTHADWWRAGHGGRLMRSYPDRLVELSRQRSVHFIAVSKAIRRAAIAYGLPAERLTVRHIGIRTSQFARGGQPLSRRPAEVLFVGRLVEKKGAIYLIQAAARLRDRVPGLRLTFLGDGPERARLVEEALRLGVRAEFLGAQPHDEVRRRLGSARALCLPSVIARNGDAEGLPIVLLEAQAAGVPGVTSAEGGREEGVVDGVTGFAVAERDVVQLASRLETLMLDGAIVDAMSERARAFVRERFDIASCTRALEDLYDGVVGCALEHPVTERSGLEPVATHPDHGAR